MTPDDVLKFWFEDIEPKQRWLKDETFDELLRQKFLETHTKAVAGELFHWRDTANGRLAEIIIIDQFSRNMFRNKPESFAYDRIALTLAQEAVRQRLDQEIKEDWRSFLYLPYMHSESKEIQEVSIQLFTDMGGSLKFAEMHKKIIDQFRRYPHRNEILGRESTPEEVTFLKEPNSSF